MSTGNGMMLRVKLMRKWSPDDFCLWIKVCQIQKNQSRKAIFHFQDPPPCGESDQPLWNEVRRKWLTLPLKWFAAKYPGSLAWLRKYYRLLQFRPRRGLLLPMYLTTKVIRVAKATTITIQCGQCNCHIGVTTDGLYHLLRKHRHHISMVLAADIWLLHTQLWSCRIEITASKLLDSKVKDYHILRWDNNCRYKWCFDGCQGDLYLKKVSIPKKMVNKVKQQ